MTFSFWTMLTSSMSCSTSKWVCFNDVQFLTLLSFLLHTSQYEVFALLKAWVVTEVHHKLWALRYDMQSITEDSLWASEYEIIAWDWGEIQRTEVNDEEQKEVNILNSQKLKRWILKICIDFYSILHILVQSQSSMTFTASAISASVISVSVIFSSSAAAAAAVCLCCSCLSLL